MIDDQPTVAAGVEDAWPLTPAQAGMLFHTRLAPGRGIYLGQIAARLPEGLDIARFRASWDAAIARHGALRSLILWKGFDDPVQVVRKQLAPEWTELVPGGEDAFEAHLAKVRVEGLDLAAGPVNRFVLQPRPDGGWRFAWSCHHALVDAWSASLVLADVEAAYASGRALPEAPQFRAFADWMAGRDVASAENFWREALAGHAEPARLQLARPARVAEPGRETARLGTAELQALRAAAARLGVTLSGLVQTAWAVVLHRATGRDDVVFGIATTLRGPRIPAVDRIVGNFVTTLPARFRLDRHATLADLARARHEAALEASTHEHLSPAEIARLAPLPPGEALFETLVAMESQEKLEPNGIFQDLTSSDRSGYPAALLVRPGEELDLTLVHDGVRVDTDGARLLLSMVCAALSAMPEALASPSCELAIMSSNALECASAGIDGGPLPEAPPVEAAVARQARETPDEAAIVAADGTLTYAEMDRLADLWARRLAARGLGPGDRIAILMERGRLMPVALLAVLRSGCAYVPLDARYPAARTAAMLEAAAPAAVLTTASLAAHVPGALILDTETSTLPEAVPRSATADDLAYVIFTSGSTGTPKGVAVRRRNLATSNVARRLVYGSAPKRFLLLSPFAFDSSVVGLFWTMAGGGTLHLPRPGAEADPVEIAALIAERRITHTLCLPSVLDLLLSRTEADLSSLDTVVAAGEQLPRAVAERFAAALPGSRLFNEYGPTEATVWCLAEEVRPEAGPVPVGRPIPGARALIRDSRGRPVPDGLPGELLIGGAGVAEGYLGRPDLTEARFLPDPADPAALLYRTGDLVRRRPDGRLDWLGRVDGQAKIRGHRVEPTEVEASLLALPGVEEAVVEARYQGPESVLAAWIRATPGQTPDLETLRGALRQTLPDWMVPTRWRLVDVLPRLPSGKIDRAHLPDPSPETTDQARAAPQTELESRLAEIWRRTLWLEEVPGVTDDFLALGGHSLLAMRLVDAVERDLGLRLPLSALARMTTVRDQAAALESQLPETPIDDTPHPDIPPGPFEGLGPDELRDLRVYMAGWPGERIGEGSLLFRLNGKGRNPPLLWCFNGGAEFRALAERLGPDQPLIGFRSGEGLLDLSRDTEQGEHRRLALQVLPDVLRAYPEGPFLLGGNCQGASAAMELALLLIGFGRQVSLLTVLEAAPLRTYDGPLALIFGRESYWNPYTRFLEPELGWAARFRRHSVNVIPGNHGTYFQEPNLSALATVLRRRFAEIAAHPAAALPMQGRAVEWLQAELPERLPAGRRQNLRVVFRNAGDAVWAQTSDSGLRLAARWLAEDGVATDAPGTAAPLISGLAPGAVATVDLEIVAPPWVGQAILEIDVVEEGMAWFSELGTPALRVALKIEMDDAPAVPAQTEAETLGKTPDVPTVSSERPADDRLAAGRRAVALGRYAEGLRLLGSAREDVTAAFRELGRSALHLGDHLGAEADLGTALRLDRNDAEALAAFGKLRGAQGRRLEAIWFLRRSLAIREDPETRYALRKISARLNLPHRAWRKLGRLLRSRI